MKTTDILFALAAMLGSCQIEESRSRDATNESEKRDYPITLVPSDLYRYDRESEASPLLRVNGEEVDRVAVDGFAVVDRIWSAGDVVELELPMPVRRVLSHPAVTTNTGHTALERGPLVYCVEGADNGGHALDVVIRADATPAVAPSELLGGMLTIRAAADGIPGDDALSAIPYFAWSHRGPNEMAVWLRTSEAER